VRQLALAQGFAGDEAIGKQKMLSYKTLKEKYGKQTADKIKDRKKGEEKTRDAFKDPRPRWFQHSECPDDPATR
ncbi:hypothetical protein AK812_SmicGene47682, partial [Symbiodinium microadriaticum]